MATILNNLGVEFPDGTTQTSSAIEWDSAVQASNFTASTGQGYAINTTTASVTMTLPASPTVGHRVGIVDYAGTSGTNNIIVNPNGANLNGQTGSAYIRTNREGLIFFYVDATQGWTVIGSAYITSIPYIVPYSVSYLVVAGGGGSGGTDGGSAGSGGGGAGGFLTGSTTLIPNATYTITVGAAGTAGPAGSPYKGGNGTNSIVSGAPIATITASGGGGGGGGPAPLRTTTNAQGNAGGSGGGGGSWGSGNPVSLATGGGAGTPGQGNTGGGGSQGGGGNNAGGGGGAAAAGSNRTTGGPAGPGGAGSPSSITGTSVSYAGGGGGGADSSFTGGAGGIGGGGGGAGSRGANNGSNNGPGINNLGGGGGGVGYQVAGRAGGRGVVILSIPTASYRGTYGPEAAVSVTTSGVNTILQFVNSGTYTA